MDRIKKLKIKKQDGTFSDYIPIGADAENIDTADGESVEIKLNKKPYYYNSVADMKADNKLKAGDMAITLGYYSANDGGAGKYKIVNDSSLVDDGGSVHDLVNGFKAELIVENDTINIKQFGSYGDGVADDSEFFTSEKEYELNKGIFILDKNSLLKNLNNIYGSGSIKFKNYNYAQNSGVIPIKKINDEIFLSMNLPSDGNTFMSGRINGNLISPDLSSNDLNIHSIGAIYKNIDEVLPENFILYIGKIKLFGYRKSTQKWEILKEDIVPNTIRKYRIPWTGNISHEVDYSYDEEKKMYKIELTSADFDANSEESATGYTIHFWGGNYILNDNDANDIIQLASCYEAMVESVSGEDIKNKFLGASAIDRTQSNTTYQVGYSRNVAINNYPTMVLLHTVKNSEYDNLKTYKLKKLFNKEVLISKTLFEDKNRNSFDNIVLNNNINKYKTIEIFYSFKREGYDETQYSIKIDTNYNTLIKTILTAEVFYTNNENLEYITVKKPITINNINVINSNRIAVYKRVSNNTEIVTGAYKGPNYISINKIVGYIL